MDFRGGGEGRDSSGSLVENGLGGRGRQGGRDRTQDVQEPSRREVTAVWVRRQGNRVNGPFEITRGTGRQALDLGRTQGESQQRCLCVPPALS